MPLFSVIIPVYNARKYLQECINSVLKQKYQNFQIILINDNSTDGSKEICKSYSNNKKFKIINNKKTIGVGLSRNKGISIASGKYLIFLDSDDYLYLGCFEGLEKIFKKNKKRIDVVITKFSADAPPYSNDYLFKFEKYFSKPYKTEDFISHINKINYQTNVCWHYIIKKELITKNKLNFINAKINEDQEFVTRLLCVMNSFIFYKDKYYFHRETPGSLSRSIDLKTTQSFLLLLNKLSQFFYKSNWSKQKKKFIQFQIMTLITKFSSHLILNNNNDLSKVLNFLNKLNNFFEVFNYKDLNFLKKKKKNISDLLNYKKKVIMKIIKKADDVRFKNNRLFIYCANIYGIATFNVLKQNNYNVVKLIDDDKFLQSKKIHGIQVNDPSFLFKKLKNNTSNIMIIVCALTLKTFKSISTKLQKKGIRKNKLTYNSF